MEAGTGKVDDLATLATLDEPGLLQEIRKRYNDDTIYTYIGDILIAVNPYKELAIYDESYRMRYHALPKRDTEPPHIFSISDGVYQSLAQTGQSQCCVVSGESGAGKTESTKYMVQHIAQLSHHDSSDLHERIVRVNPLLEAFGNAQTVINNNSSRFGKYIQLDFDDSGGICGAHISEYLLEKSRVVSQAHGEKNFHIFYYLFAGLGDELLQANKLAQPDDHRILRPVDGSKVFGSASDKQQAKAMWDDLHFLFKTTGFSEPHVDGILATLAGILHLTDIEFVEDDKATTDGVIIKNELSLEMAAELLIVKPEDLASALVSNVTVVKGTGESLLVHKNVTQANDGRDALAKALYGRMFAWTVRQINILLKPSGRRVMSNKSIGILDLAGFENFQNNSFEQLCINVANEQLHFFFNQHIFQWEMEEYKREGIEGKDVKFIDNKELLELMCHPKKGMFFVLDEQLRIPQASDKTFIDKISVDYKTNQYFQRPRGQNLNFVIRHYAGEVIYNAENFLEKNRDTLSVNILDSMKRSDSQFISDMFHVPMDKRGSMVASKNVDGGLPQKSRMSVLLKQSSKKFNTSQHRGSRISMAANKKAKENPKYGTVGRRAGTDAASVSTMGAHFMESLTHLMGKLKAGEPHFIRCIKPNTHKLAGVFQDDLVLQQLRYTGVLETVKIRRQGYATRLPFDLFLRRYKFISFPISGNVQASADSCNQVLKKTDLKDYEIGKTKVFLRYWHTEQLQMHVDKQTKSITMCQKHVRRFLARKELQRRKEKARLQAQQVRDLCEEVVRLSQQMKEIQLQHLEHDRAEHQRKLEEQKRKEREAEEKKVKEKKLAEEKKRAAESQANLAAETQARLAAEQRQREEQQRIQQQSVVPPVVDDFPEDIPRPPPSLMKSMSNSRLLMWDLLQESLSRYSELSSQIWAKVFYMEKAELVGKVYLRDWDVVINSTDVKYDGRVIGLTYEQFDNPVRDTESVAVMKQIREGVEIACDEEGSILMKNLSPSAIIAKDYTNPNANCLSPDLVEAFGQVPKWPVKIFDMKKYKHHVAQELQKPEINVAHLQMLSMSSFAFVKNSLDDLSTPCWMFIINFKALELLGNEDILQELIQMSNVAVTSDRQVRLRREWKELYRPRRASTDSYRSSSASSYDPTGPGPLGTIRIRKNSHAGIPLPPTPGSAAGPDEVATSPTFQNNNIGVPFGEYQPPDSPQQTEKTKKKFWKMGKK